VRRASASTRSNSPAQEEHAVRQRQGDGDGLAEDPLGRHEAPASQLPLVLQQVAHVGADSFALHVADGGADQRVLLEECLEDPVDDGVGGGEPGLQRLLAGAEAGAVGGHRDEAGAGQDAGVAGPDHLPPEGMGHSLARDQHRPAGQGAGGGEHGDRLRPVARGPENDRSGSHTWSLQRRRDRGGHR
jgi:hypothetical protein